MTDTKTTLQIVIDQTIAADLNPLRSFLFSNPSEPLIATGSGGAETAGEFAALLYGARGGVATSMTPYTFNSLSDAALKTAKILLVSKGGHNNDIVFATRRALEVNPAKTAAVNFSDSFRNDLSPYAATTARPSPPRTSVLSVTILSFTAAGAVLWRTTWKESSWNAVLPQPGSTTTGTTVTVVSFTPQTTWKTPR